MKIRTGTIENAAAISQLVYALAAKYIAIDFDFVIESQQRQDEDRRKSKDAGFDWSSRWTMPTS
jgi:hypothetical protein